MLSGRYFNRVNKYPSVLAFNPEWNMMAKLSYDMTENTTLRLQAMHQGTNNTGDPKLTYGSSQDLVQQGGATIPSEIRSPFAPYKWFPAGAKYIYTGRQTIFPPQYIRNTSLQARLTHIFSPRTYLEISLSHYNLTQDVDYRRDNLWYLSHEDYQTAQTDPEYLAPFWFDESPHSLEPTYQPGDLITFDSKSRSLTLKADFTSQVTDHHLLKTGLEVSPQYSEQVTHSAGERNVVVNDWMEPGFNPWEAAAYFQDKIEVQGMVINAGVRVDAYNLNKNVNYTIFDPAAISDITDGNSGVGVISFDPDGEYAVKPKTPVAVSPRLGISHPITESTVLHFMYGHFNQRPSWQQLGAFPTMINAPVDERWDFPLLTTFPAGALVSYNFWTNQTGNPALKFQRMIQYEVGFDQSIANLARLDITLYYKAGTDLTNVGFMQGQENYGTTHELRANIWPDPYNHLNTTPGEGLGRFFIPINGGRMDARGLEFTLDSNFSRFLKMRAIYNMSWSTTGRYGPSMIFIPRPDHNYTKVEPDDYYGGDENLNERWNPTHTLRVNAHLSTPADFGPSLGRFHPLSLWNLDIYHQYASPERFTYHSVEKGDFSSEPNNRKWKPHNKTNLRVSKRFKLVGDIKTVLSVDVINLFNNRVLRLMPEGSNELKQYMEEGELPQVKLTYQKKNPETGKWESAEWVETDVWSIYSPDLMPREVFFGIGFEF